MSLVQAHIHSYQRQVHNRNQWAELHPTWHRSLPLLLVWFLAEVLLQVPHQHRKVMSSGLQRCSNRAAHPPTHCNNL